MMNIAGGFLFSRRKKMYTSDNLMTIRLPKEVRKQTIQYCKDEGLGDGRGPGMSKLVTRLIEKFLTEAGYLPLANTQQDEAG
jgi:hypothetical protein